MIKIIGIITCILLLIGVGAYITGQVIETEQPPEITIEPLIDEINGSYLIEMRDKDNKIIRNYTNG